MKVTTLVENTVLEEKSNLHVEHGLSFFIEHNGQKILLDLGYSDLFLKNAKKLNCNILDVDICIITHGHYDHGGFAGGMRSFFEQNKKAKLYMKTEALGNYWSIKPEKKQYIGLDLETIKKNKDRIVLLNNLTEISKGLFIVTKIEKRYKTPLGNKTLLKKENEEFVPDDFLHELIVVFKDREGLIIITGCAHSGVLNMVDTVKKVFPNEKIKGIIGGFHLANFATGLMNEDEKSVKTIGKKLYRISSLNKIYTGHCTGEVAFNVLKLELSQKLYFIKTGSVFEI